MEGYLVSILGTKKDKVNCSFYFKIRVHPHGKRCTQSCNKFTRPLSAWTCAITFKALHCLLTVCVVLWVVSKGKYIMMNFLRRFLQKQKNRNKLKRRTSVINLEITNCKGVCQISSRKIYRKGCDWLE